MASAAAGSAGPDRATPTAAAAVPAHMLSFVSYCPVNAITDAFHHSGAVVDLEVVRTWPIDADAAGADPTRRVLRIEAIDFCRAGTGSATATAAAATGAAPGALDAHTPIEIFLHGLWANVRIEKYDVLSVRRCLVHPAPADADHPWQLVLDESAECRDATLTVKGWKQRLLMRDGGEYSMEGLQRQQEEAEEAAAAAVEQRAATGPAAQKTKAGAGAAAATAADAASSSFQTAASLATGSAGAPILLDDSPAADDVAGVGGAAAAPAAGGNKKKRKRGSDSAGYAYTPLGEVRKRLNEKLNFYGVVIRSRPVKMTGGTDFMLGLVVGDMSLRNETDSVTFNVFRQKRSALPEDGTIAAGDIVRLHRASVKAHPQPDKPDNLVGAVPNRATGFILIRGGEGESMEPYFNSSESYMEVDEEIVRELRQFAKKLRFRMNAPKMRTFAELDNLATPFFDAYCAIVHTDTTGTLQQRISGADPAANTLPSVPLAYIWDGTDLPPLIQLQRGMLPNRCAIPLAPAAGASAAATAVVPSVVMPLYGSILPLALPSDRVSSFLPHPATPPGQPLYVQLHNVALNRGRNGSAYLQFNSTSKITQFTPADLPVQRMMQAYNTRKEHESAKRRLLAWSSVHASPLTIPKEPALPLTPIKWLLSNEATAVSKSRIRARVIVPYTMEDAEHSDRATAVTAPAESKEGESAAAAAASDVSSSLLPLESICKVQCRNCCIWFNSDHLSYGYFVRLLLHDSTGLLPVLLCGKEAEHDLFHMPPDNLHLNRTARRLVHERLATLMQPRAFIDSNVHSYQVAERVDEAEMHGAAAAATPADSQFNGSQELMSQELAAFFAPQLHNPDDMADGEGGAGRQPPMRMRQVHRLVDCNFKRPI